MLRKAITKLQAVIIAVIVIVAAIAVVLAYLYPLGPLAPDVILIGVPAPLTGPGAQMGEPIPWIVSYIENVINKEGGIFLEEYGRKIPVKFLLKDNQADFDLTATITEELIIKDKVPLILVPIGALAMPAAGMKAEKYGVPCILHFCPASTIEIIGPSQHVYYTTWSWSEVVQNILKACKLIETNGKIGLLAVNNAEGQRIHRMVKNIAPGMGFEVIDYGLYSPGLIDFSPYIERMKTDKAEICFAYCWFEESAIFWRQCHEMGYKPKVAYIGMAAAEPSTVAALGGDLGLGLIALGLFSPAFPFKDSITGKLVKELYDMYTKETGRTAGVNMASYVGFEITVDVIRRAGSLSKEKILRALSETNLNTAWGNINFKKLYDEALMKIYATVEPELLIQPDHTCVLPSVIIQWFKEDGRWVDKIIYVGRWTEIPVQAKMIPIPGSE
ncbi:MAG: ABC transporter substrate-binding protein [Candidatus Bathyarchaeia archaeon]